MPWNIPGLRFSGFEVFARSVTDLFECVGQQRQVFNQHKTMSLAEQAYARFEELCTLLRRNDSSVTRFELPSGHVRGYGCQLGEVLLENTVVTYLWLDICQVLKSEEATLDRAAPLLRYLRTSSALEEVTLSSYSDLPLLQQLGREIIEAIALNPSVKIVDVYRVYGLLPDALVLLLTTTMSLTTLKFTDFPFLRDRSILIRVATALGSNRTIQDVTIKLYGRLGRNVTSLSIEMDEPLLRALGTHSTLQRLCIMIENSDDHADVIHVEAIVSLLLETQTLHSLELHHYKFSRRTLLPILDALKANSTVTSLCLRLCTMDEEATQGFVDFVRQFCNRGLNKLSHVALTPHSRSEMFAGENVGNVAGTMLIGSSLQSLHWSDHEENGRRARLTLPRYLELRSNVKVAFFTTLLQHKGQIRLESLTIDKLNVAGANAMVAYLHCALSLRNLTVLRMDENVDSVLVVAALRRNGSLHSVDITKAPAQNDGGPLEPFFTADELRRVQAFCIRNQSVPMLLAEPLSSRDTPTDDSSNNLHLYTRLFAATRPADRTAPNNLVTGLLSGDQALGM